MGLLDKLFGWKQPPHQDIGKDPDLDAIRFGRYTDHTKTKFQIQKWHEAEDLFKSKNWDESLAAFFDYLRDDLEDNVNLTRQGRDFTFEIYQGTTCIQGHANEHEVAARVSLARMPKASIPVMRRLLEMNFMLYYGRFAMQDDTLMMLFDAPRDMASPNKLYFGLKELATRADKQDDLLVADFNTLQPIENAHVRLFSVHETEVKYRYFCQWIENTLHQVDSLNQDSFSGGIAYLLLTLLYRIDFLIVPEGKLLYELERINGLYWNNKDEKTAVERNQLLKEAFRKLLTWPKEDITRSFYRAKSTFGVTLAKPYQEVIDSIRSSKENSIWYTQNKYEDIALRLLEYGVAYPQFAFSVPKPFTALLTLIMQITLPDFFNDLGYTFHYVQDGSLNPQAIESALQNLLATYREQYPHLKLATQKLNYSSTLSFVLSLLTEMESLQFDNS
jgi:hypothetical protein